MRGALVLRFVLFHDIELTPHKEASNAALSQAKLAGTTAWHSAP